MEAFTYISCVILGIALGVAGDWFFWQIRFKEADERVREDSKAVGQSFNAQIEEKERQLSDLNAKFVAAREEVASLKSHLEDEARQLAASQELNKKIPVLEKSLNDQREIVEQLQTAKAEMAGIIVDLEAKVVKERKALEDGLVFVHGSHYLPASVVRNLTSHEDHEKVDGDSE
ncbi:MAG: hypothetical protein OEL55_06685 [Desulfobulbaceae bacterium]|nr:hypothetical protein [Desulfobulbaceae bacterium]